MNDLIKVFLFQGQERLDNVTIEKSEFERALDALFADDEEGISIRVGKGEVRGVTDIILAGADIVEEREDEESLENIDQFDHLDMAA